MPHALEQFSFLREFAEKLAAVVAVVGLVAATLWAKRLPAWFRSVRAFSWPVVEGKIEDVSVTSFAEQSLGQMAYSYLVEGERYSGYYCRQFADEQAAWDHIQPLKGQPIFVRYKPGNPEVSAVRCSDQHSILAADQQNYFSGLLQSLRRMLGLADLN
jgi:uncharacterized protein DUF3592